MKASTLTLPSLFMPSDFNDMESVYMSQLSEPDVLNEATK